MNRRQAIAAMLCLPIAATKAHAFTSGGEWRSFGSGSLAMLHGTERIIAQEILDLDAKCWHDAIERFIARSEGA